MNREEKINKILEMTKEMFILAKYEYDEEELDKLYLQTKIALETFKELYGNEEGKDNE